MKSPAPRIARFILTLSLLLTSSAAVAGPWLAPGDSALRADIQMLADTGVLDAPVTTWPLAWGDIATALQTPVAELNAEQMAALMRVRMRFSNASLTGQPRLNAHASLAKNPRGIRSFEDGPREDAEVGVGVEWTGDWWAVSAQGQWAHNPTDDREWRADGSYAGIALGNWMLAAAATDRWWGPGWQGSLILGNNARPIPALTLERNSTQALRSKWLSWIGPWDLAIMYGLLENDRAVSDAQMFGMRLNFKPFHSLEIGLSRTSLLCGDGQSCSAGTVADMLVFSGTDASFDHLAGYDARWSTSPFGVPMAFYFQFIGEDGNFFPGDYLGQFGAETRGRIESLGNYHIFLEWSDTECDFRFRRSIRNDSGPGSGGCAYTNGLYQTGQTYRGRSLAHGFDSDASVFTLGGVLTDHGDHAWLANISVGNLNRRNARVNTVAANKTRYREIEFSHRRSGVYGGELYTGLGYDYRRDTVTGRATDDIRAFVEWSFTY